jgi:hypothetical protein
LADRLGDLRSVRLEREVAGIGEADFRVGVAQVNVEQRPGDIAAA